MVEHVKSIDGFLDAIQQKLIGASPEIVALFNIYASEARFGRKALDENLKTIPRNSSILEVGAGSLILSCQLAREGFAMYALEPIGEGFTHFKSLQTAVLDVAKTMNCQPHLVNSFAENMKFQSEFEFAFSINVMEHVVNVEESLQKIAQSLKAEAKYRFICPNYAFPFEPHFNIPTLFSKSLTERYFKKLIITNKMPDPWGTWQSLNWITVLKVINLYKNVEGYTLTFNKNFLFQTFIRSVEDQEFSARRPWWFNQIVRLIVCLKIHYLGKLVPVYVQPQMDCTITKESSSETFN